MTSIDSRYAGPTDRHNGRHPISIGHLVMGIAFLGIVVIWALLSSDAADGDDIRWLLPVPWVLAGFAGLIATTTRSRRRSDRAYDAPVAATSTPSFAVADEPFDPADPADPADPLDPLDPTGPADPADPNPTEEIR